MKRLGVFGSAGLALAVLSGCGTPPRPRVDTGPRPLCFLRRPGPRPGQIGSRSLRPEQWYALIVRGYEPGSGRLAEPAQDCTGQRVQWLEPPQTCAEPAPESARLPPRPLTEDDLVIQRVPGNQRLVWAVVERYDNGEGVGPVALAEFLPDGVAVRALGTLRAMPRRARLRIETVAGSRILVAEGERCESDDPTTCRRSVRLLTQRDDRFVATPLVLEGGECVGPARFELAREDTVPLETGWLRHFALNTSLQYGAFNITVHEQVVVQDSDPRQPAAPPRPFRRVDADRTVYPADGRLVTNAVSLWSRMLVGRGAVSGDGAARR